MAQFSGFKPSSVMISTSRHRPASNSYTPVRRPYKLKSQSHVGAEGSVYSSNFVTLVVGGQASPAKEPSPKIFQVHEPLLFNASPVLRAMLFGPQAQTFCDTLPTWKEQQDRIINLPEDRVEDWSMLAQWLYAGGSSARDLLSTSLTESLSRQELLALVKITQAGLADSQAEKAMSIYPESQAAQPNVAPIVSKHSGSCGNFNSDKSNSSWLHREQYDQRTDSHTLACGSEGNHDVQLSPITSSAYQPCRLVFGKLIRLYILADKYAITTGGIRSGGNHDISVNDDIDHQCDNDTSLQSQIVLRIRAMNKIANVVPNRQDVERVWVNIPAVQDQLKNEVLRLYAKLSKKSFAAILGNNQREKRSRTDLKSDEQDVLRASNATWMRDPECQDESEWHAGFLRELMLRRDTIGGA